MAAAMRSLFLSSSPSSGNGGGNAADDGESRQQNLSSTWSDEDQVNAATVAVRMKPKHKCVVVLHTSAITNNTEGHANHIELQKRKFVTPNDMVFAQFVRIVRTHCKRIEPTQALFFLFRDSRCMVPMQKSFVEMEQHQDKDGIFHIRIAPEHTFGGVGPSALVVPRSRHLMSKPWGRLNFLDPM